MDSYTCPVCLVYVTGVHLHSPEPDPPFEPKPAEVDNRRLRAAMRRIDSLERAMSSLQTELMAYRYEAAHGRDR